METITDVGKIADMTSTLNSLSKLTHSTVTARNLAEVIEYDVVYSDTQGDEVATEEQAVVKFVPLGLYGYRLNERLYLLFRRRNNTSVWIGARAGTLPFLKEYARGDNTFRNTLLLSIYQLLYDVEYWSSVDHSYSVLLNYLQYSLLFAMNYLPENNNGLVYNKRRTKVLFNTKLLSKYGNFIVLMLDIDTEGICRNSVIIDDSTEIKKHGFATEMRPIPPDVLSIPNLWFRGTVQDVILKSDERLTHIISERIQRISAKKNRLTEMELSFLITNSVQMSVDLYRVNPEYIHPMYCREMNEIHQLLPVMFSSVAFGALVLRKRSDGKWVPQTVLDIRQAYADARVIKKPSDEWLSLNKVVVQ